jgi:Clp amino terminal domain, pathogenicity island component
MPMLSDEGDEHLLLGILREGSAAAELINQGVTVEGIRGGIMFLIGRQEGTPGSQPDFNPRTKKVLTLAGEEAQRLGGNSDQPSSSLSCYPA